MKTLGIVRKVDKLGRLVLPVELRQSFGMEGHSEAMEIYVEEDMIILKKYNPSCIFCDNADNLIDFKDQKVCKECLKEMVSKL